MSSGLEEGEVDQIPCDIPAHEQPNNSDVRGGVGGHGGGSFVARLC